MSGIQIKVRSRASFTKQRECRHRVIVLKRVSPFFSVNRVVLDYVLVLLKTLF